MADTLIKTPELAIDTLSYSLTPKENPKDKIEVEIGDSKDLTQFQPQFKVMRWDNEVNFSARLISDEEIDETITQNDEKITWGKGNILADFYDLPITEEHTEGGMEFEVILKERPKTNVVTFTLNTKGLDFFYQPELTVEEKLQGIKKPENVIGSYAVYASEQKTNYVGGKEYKTGKVGHIYRPRVEDAEGNTVWGELNVDTNNGLLTVTIPDEWLDKAVYPVRHAAGLTFGYTTAGSGSISTDNIMVLCKFPLIENASVSKLTIYCNSQFGNTNSKGLIHNDSSDYPGSRSAISSPLYLASGSTKAWRDYTLSASLSPGNYWLGVIPDTYRYNIYQDSGGGVNQRYHKVDSYSSPSDPAPSGMTGGSYINSVYATYTAVASGTNMKINIGDVFKDVTELKINIGDVWKTVTQVKINIGDVWKTIF